MDCLTCFKSKPKKSNKGLATFDKKNYFPVHFVENNLHDPTSKKFIEFSNDLDKKLNGKSLIKVNIAQALEEDVDVPADPNEQEHHSPNNYDSHNIQLGDRNMGQRQISMVHNLNPDEEGKNDQEGSVNISHR